MSYIGNQPTIGQYRKLDDISGSFNGSLTAFTMQVGSTNVSAGSVFQLLISLGGVIQEPGTDFTVSGSTITFTTAPAASLSFFGIMMGQPLNTATPGDSTVTGAKIVDGTITGGKLAAAFNYDSGLLFLDDTNNRVGVGTTSPSTILEASTSANTGTSIRITNSDTGTSTNAAFSAHNGTVDALFGIGGTNYTTYGAVRANAAFIYCNQAEGIGLTADNASGFINFVTGGTDERARIESGGRLLVGTTDSTGTQLLKVNGTTGGSTQGGAMSLTCGHVTPGNGATLGILNFGTETQPQTCSAISGNSVTGWTSGSSHPSQLIFWTTPSGSTTLTERLRLYQGGDVRCFGIYDNTTSSGANVHVASNGFVIRSTSSIKYKTDVETLQDSYADALLECRPVWYHSLCKNDNPEHSYWGFIAEEVAEIDPRLVHWKTSEPVRKEDGSVEEVPCEPEPEGVQYDRFVPHLVNLIKRQKEQLETQAASIASLEARLAALEGGTP